MVLTQGHTARKFLGWDLNSVFIYPGPCGPDSPKCQVEIVWNHQQGQWQNVVYFQANAGIKCTIPSWAERRCFRAFCIWPHFTLLTIPMHLSTVIVPTLHMGKLSLGGEVGSLFNDDFWEKYWWLAVEAPDHFVETAVLRIAKLAFDA